MHAQEDATRSVCEGSPIPPSRAAWSRRQAWQNGPIIAKHTSPRALSPRCNSERSVGRCRGPAQVECTDRKRRLLLADGRYETKRDAPKKTNWPYRRAAGCTSQGV